MSNTERVSIEEGRRVLAGYFSGCVMGVAFIFATAAIFINYWAAYNSGLRGALEIFLFASGSMAFLAFGLLMDSYNENSWLVGMITKVTRIFEAEDAVAYSEDHKKH